MNFYLLKRREIHKLLFILLIVNFFIEEQVFLKETFALEPAVFIESSSTFPAESSSTITEASSTISASSSAVSLISDEEIDLFLFHISQDLQEKVRKLDGNLVQHFPIPILFGVTLEQLKDTWGERRPGGRIHKGTDIIASRDSFIVSPTNAVVTNIGYDKNGGNFVLTANPGGEQFYYAHLDSIAAGVAAGKTLAPGDIIGYVGKTGNARRTLPHLHFSIYYNGVAVNPYPRLDREFSLKEKMTALARIVDESEFSVLMALKVIDEYRQFLDEAKLQDFELPKTIVLILENNDILAKAQLLSVDMQFKNKGESVRLLQQILIDADIGPAARALGRAGATGYFGARTQNALAEYQKTAGISPSQGRFGPVTRARMLNLLSQNIANMPSETTAQTFQKTQSASLITFFDRNLEVGSAGDAVKQLQNLLIEANIGNTARMLANVGATGYFGLLTKKVLAEYQSAMGIAPAKGYFGPITRIYMLKLLTRNSTQIPSVVSTSSAQALP